MPRSLTEAPQPLEHWLLYRRGRLPSERAEPMEGAVRISLDRLDDDL